MRTLTFLAVLGVAFASPQQAYYGSYAQPRYVGPLASTVPAGVDGTITPVSDTPEVAAARGAFFNAYNAQLAAVGAARYGAPVVYHGAYSAPTAYHAVPQVFAGHYGVPHVSYNHGVPVQVRDTPEVSAAKAEFFRLYNQQAAAAAAAPDYDTPYGHHY